MRYDQPRLSRARWWMIGIGVLSAVLGIGWWEFGQPRYLAAVWRQQLLAADVDNPLLLARKLASLGDRGLPVLAAALHSPDAGTAARQVLIEELNAWALLAPQEQHRKLALLASCLANNLTNNLASDLPGSSATSWDSDEPAPRAAAGAVELAERILLWPHATAPEDWLTVVVNCEQVLRAAPPPLVSTARIATHGAAADGMVWSSSRSNLPTPLELARLPGGGLPLDLARLEPAEPQRLAPSVAAPIAATGDSNAASNPLRGAARLVAFDPVGDDAAHDVAEVRTFDSRADAMRAATLTSADESLSQLATIPLAEQLQAPATQDAALKELERRGYSRADVELLKQLTSPQALTRRDAAELLPQCAGISAAQWLLHLADDPDASVRRVAIGFMATSGDRALRARVEEAARTDADPAIRRDAAKLQAR